MRVVIGPSAERDTLKVSAGVDCAPLCNVVGNNAPTHVDIAVPRGQPAITLLMSFCTHVGIAVPHRQPPDFC